MNSEPSYLLPVADPVNNKAYKNFFLNGKFCFFFTYVGMDFHCQGSSPVNCHLNGHACVTEILGI